MTSDLDIHWLAGFIDGEGCFGLVTDKRPRSNCIKPSFQISNTVEENMRKVKAIVSDIVGREVRYVLTKLPTRVTYRPSYYLYVTRQSELVALCERIRPHVVGKGPHIDLMLRYLATTPKALGTRGSRYTGSSITPEHWQMVTDMSRLNRKYAPGEWRSQLETERVAPTTVEETVRPLA